VEAHDALADNTLARVTPETWPGRRWTTRQPRAAVCSWPGRRLTTRQPRTATYNKTAEDKAAADNTVSGGAAADDTTIDVKAPTPQCSWLCRRRGTRPGAEDTQAWVSVGSAMMDNTVVKPEALVECAAPPQAVHRPFLGEQRAWP
jgi:hypothetical protein